MKIYRLVEYIPAKGEIVDLQKRVYFAAKTAKGVRSRIIGDRLNAIKFPNKDDAKLYRSVLMDNIFIQETDANWVRTQSQ